MFNRSFTGRWPAWPERRREMKMVGIALVVLGIAALFYGGIGYNRHTTILDVGGVKATTTEHKNIPIAPATGMIAVIGGIVLLVAPRRRLA
jgi:uncharacterized protein YjeT (DUF2065 family)